MNKRQLKKARKPRSWLTRLLQVLGILLLIPTLLVGTVAVLHLTYLDSSHPVLRCVVVSGDSMVPTFQAGDHLLFVGRAWREGSIVVANVPEEGVIVKRVVALRPGMVVITGDNQRVSVTYEVPREAILGTFLCRTLLHFDLSELEEGEEEETGRVRVPKLRRPSTNR